MDVIYNDGGRHKAGLEFCNQDCVVRAIAISLNKDYLEVYNEVICFYPNVDRKGIYSNTAKFKELMYRFGYYWLPEINKIRLKDLPNTKTSIIVVLWRHFTVLINGTIHDICDPTQKLVKGYWVLT